MRELISKSSGFLGLFTLTMVWKYWLALTSAIISCMKSLVGKILPEGTLLPIWSRNQQAERTEKLYANLVNLINFIHINYLNPLWKSFKSWIQEYIVALQCEEIEVEMKIEDVTKKGTTESSSSVMEEGHKSMENENQSDVDSDDQDEQAVESSDFVVSSSDDDYDPNSPSDAEMSSGAETMSSDPTYGKPKSGPEIVSQIIAQAEWYFSDEHLAMDAFLLKHCRRRADGYVSLKLVAGLRKIRQVSRDFPTVLAALRLSDKLEVDNEASKIRRRDPLPPELKNMPIAKKDRRREQAASSTSENGERSDESAADLAQQTRPFSSNSGSGQGNFRRRGGNSTAGYYRRGNNRFSVQYGPGYYDAFGSQTAFRRRSISPPDSPLGASHHSPDSSECFLRPQGNKGPRAPRPKSMPLGENPMIEGMSPWLMRRKAAAEGHVSISTVIRQPRGPDGTKGFMVGPCSSLVRAN